MSIPANTVPMTGHDTVVIYVKSDLAPQTTPFASAIVDGVASVSGVGLVDLDLDAGQLGGSVTWTTPADVAQVVGCDIHTHAHAQDSLCNIFVEQMSAVGHLYNFFGQGYGYEYHSSGRPLHDVLRAGPPTQINQ